MRGSTNWMLRTKSARKLHHSYEMWYKVRNDKVRIFLGHKAQTYLQPFLLQFNVQTFYIHFFADKSNPKNFQKKIKNLVNLLTIP